MVRVNALQVIKNIMLHVIEQSVDISQNLSSCYVYVRATKTQWQIEQKKSLLSFPLFICTKSK